MMPKFFRTFHCPVDVIILPTVSIALSSLSFNRRFRVLSIVNGKEHTINNYTRHGKKLRFSSSQKTLFLSKSKRSAIATRVEYNNRPLAKVKTKSINRRRLTISSPIAYCLLPIA
ncbi:MAG: hypothetical protein F6K35_27480 [Okeania sp. SIO2H7]|nr:hypothetical protein [Okeania sp. SIO2H7]